MVGVERSDRIYDQEEGDWFRGAREELSKGELFDDEGGGR